MAGVTQRPPSRLSGPALRGAGRWCCRGAGPAGGSRQPAPPPLGRGATLGSHQLCNTRLSLLYGCEKERGGAVLGSPGGSGGESVSPAVPNCWGSAPANLLTHMCPLARASLGKGQEQGPGTRRRSPGLAAAARRQALRYVTV